ncbi:hypothetical protein TWF718_003360 [Orbilia javanica]|uniref:Uncharacterized protein n=1 Tax=Orbilia javanica TaxID=47235 RepID=A0AAN8MEN3_9PEZI
MVSNNALANTVRSLQRDIVSLQKKFNELRDAYEGLVITCQTLDVQNRKLDENIQDGATAILSLFSVSSVCEDIRIEQMNMFIAANPDIARSYGVEASFLGCSQGASLKASWGNAKVDIEIPSTESTHKLFEACYGVTVHTLRKYTRDERLMQLLSHRMTLYRHLPIQFHELYGELCSRLTNGGDYREISNVLLRAVAYTRSEILGLKNSTQ